MVTTGMITRSMAAANASGSPKTASRKRKPTASGPGHSLVTKKNKITSQPNSTKPTKTIKNLETRPKQANGRQEAMASCTQSRRSTRIAQRLTNSDSHTTTQNQDARSDPLANGPVTLELSPIHRAPIAHSKNVTSSKHTIKKALPNSTKKTKRVATIGQKTRKDDMTLAPSIANAQHSNEGTTEVEVTMEEYMVQVNRRAKAAERREILRGALGAPFPWSEFRRHVYTEFIRFHTAVTAGRVKDIHEALQLPLDDKYWSGKVSVGPIVSENRRSEYTLSNSFADSQRCW